LSWSFSGNLLAISSAGNNSENIVQVYKVIVFEEINFIGK
jgi:hypothetical protein